MALNELVAVMEGVNQYIRPLSLSLCVCLALLLVLLRLRCRHPDAELQFANALLLQKML